MGRALERFEDDALLRGAGRFLDDLDPAPGARHAAVLRSPHAHARIVRLDATRALEIPGVTGVLTGAEVAEGSRPFPAACPTEVPCYAAAAEVARYVGEPLAVVVARDRYVAEDALDAIAVEFEPLEVRMDPRAVAAETGRRWSPTAASPTATRTPPSPARTWSSARRSPSRAGRARRWSARGRRALGPRRRQPHRVDELPGAVHAAQRRRRRAPPAGRAPAAHHPARQRRQLRRQGRRLRRGRPDGARVAQARRARPLDRGPPEHLAAGGARPSARPTSRPRSRPTASCSGCGST